MSVFSEKLKLLRGELKQAEFARRIGLPQNSYSRYESGERIPDIDILSRLASKLRVSSDWLLGLDGEENLPLAAIQQEKKDMNRISGTVCHACHQKDQTITDQAESIVNLTRSLAVIVGQQTATVRGQPSPKNQKI